MLDEGPAAQAAIPVWYRGCKQQWIGLWLGIADLLDNQAAAAAKRFRSAATAVSCAASAPSCSVSCAT